MPQWTEDQKKVIGSEKKRIICSAAAGSGKTAVMIERIVRLIREGADPFSFLVITFTNAAAAEMKEKIRRRLMEERKDRVLAEAAEKAGAMEICTIHAFCQHLIRQEFQAAGTDPLFRICTGAEREQLFRAAFQKACGELRSQEDEAFLSFTEKYEPEAARNIVTQVYQFIMSLPDPFAWLREKTENIPLNYERDHPWFQTVADLLGEKLLSLRVILRQQAEMFEAYERQEAYRESWMADQKKVEAMGHWIAGEDVTREELAEGFVRLPALKKLNDLEIDWKDRYQKLRKQLKEEYDDMLRFVLMDQNQLSTEFSEIRRSLRGLEKLLETTHRHFERQKAGKVVLDFSDLEHKALEILRDQAVRSSVQERYRRIFVDECQDVSAVQDALIESLAGKENTLFMVGDVKQSIYRFRLANPGYFLRRTEEADSEENACYRLRENFRSRPEILETVNTVFRDTMKRETAEVDYTPADELRPGRSDIEGNEPAEIDLLEIGEDRTRLEAVADHVAERIAEMVREKKYDYRDMMILMPEVSADGAKLTALLRERNIPVFFDESLTNGCRVR